MEIMIDGKKCHANNGEFVLEVAKRNGISIPTLCHHDAIPGQACCRLCVVEVYEKSRSRIVVSCVYPVSEEMEVQTNSNLIRNLRRNIIKMLKERAPGAEKLDALCMEYNVTPDKRFFDNVNEKCILCGLCTQACKLLGNSAISSVMRGTAKKISTPYEIGSINCIGCGTCARICPMGAIDVKEDSEVRIIWNKRFNLVRCSECGKGFVTSDQLKFLNKNGVTHESSLCFDCRREFSVV